MYRRNDPRFRRTLNQLSQNLESANESAQANLFAFAHGYLEPCFSAVGNCISTCTAVCVPDRVERRRRRRGWSRGRAELSFDFYDDWEEEENDGLLSWGNDELDRLLQGPGNNQPARQRAMSYGARRERDGRTAANRRRSALQPHDGGADPTIIPSSSYFGFLGRLPWKIGGQGLKYKPSVADLVEHPGVSRRMEEEARPLIQDCGDSVMQEGQRRTRSATTGSGHTIDSLSSRGDIFPSEDEIDDAVPIDDEFAMVLERPATLSLPEDQDDQRIISKRRMSGLQRATSYASVTGNTTLTAPNLPTLAALRQEEDKLGKEQEADIEAKRRIAQDLALQQGLKRISTVHPKHQSCNPSKELELGDALDQSLQVEAAGQSQRSRIPRSQTPCSNASIRGTSPSAERCQAQGAMGDETPFNPARLPSFACRPD